MYVNISPAKFLIGVVIVSAPLLVLSDRGWQFAYVALVLTVTASANYEALITALNYFQSEAR